MRPRESKKARKWIWYFFSKKYQLVKHDQCYRFSNNMQSPIHCYIEVITANPVAALFFLKGRTHFRLIKSKSMTDMVNKIHEIIKSIWCTLEKRYYCFNTFQQKCRVILARFAKHPVN